MMGRTRVRILVVPFALWVTSDLLLSFSKADIAGLRSFKQQNDPEI